MKWILVCALALAAACNLSDPNPEPNGESPGEDTGSDVVECDVECTNGGCDDDGTCTCFEGYQGAACDECAASFQDNDQNGTCEPACRVDTCNNGTCSDASGTIECTCDDEHSGEFCDQCRYEFQDNDDDGVCTPGCGIAELDCSPHGVCSDETGTAECVCPAGTEGNGFNCPVVAPNAFDDSWTPYGAASIATDRANFGQFAACSEASGVSGSYELAQIGPLVGTLDLTYSDRCGQPGTCGPGYSPPAIRINDTTFDRMTRERHSAATPVVNFCVGEAYFGDVSIDVVPHQWANENVCSANNYSALDTVGMTFERAGPGTIECPESGKTLNPGFDERPPNGSSVPGWEFGGTGGDARYLEDSGGGTFLSLSASSPCDDLTASSLINIPMSDQPLAVRFKVASNGSPFNRISLGDTDYIVRDGNEEREICIPRYSHGTVDEIRFEVGGTPGTCTSSRPRSMRVDYVEVVASDKCKQVDGFVNGTFDEDSLGWGTLALSNSSGGEVRFGAIGDENVATISSPNQCTVVGTTQPFYAPIDGSLNSISLIYRLESDDITSAVMAIIGSSGELVLFEDFKATGSNFETQNTCVPKNLRGYPGVLAIALIESGSCSDPAGDPLVLADVRMQRDPACD